MAELSSVEILEGEIERGCREIPDNVSPISSPVSKESLFGVNSGHAIDKACVFVSGELEIRVLGL